MVHKIKISSILLIEFVYQNPTKSELLEELAPGLKEEFCFEIENNENVVDIRNFEDSFRLLIYDCLFTVFMYVLTPYFQCALFPMKFSRNAYDQHRLSPCNADTPCSSLQLSKLIASHRSNISTAVLRSDAL